MADSIPEEITRADVISAIVDLNRGVPHEFTDNNKYGLVYDGRTFSPRAVIGLAARRLAGRQLVPKDFHGGVESKCYQILRNLGFEIQPLQYIAVYPDEISQPEKFVEGAASKVFVNRYERSVAARDRCINHYGLQCSVCGFDFSRTYGKVGEGFIHVHHLREHSAITEEYTVDPIADLRPVCPNCHAMLHTRSPALTIEELRDCMQRQAPGS